MSALVAIKETVKEAVASICESIAAVQDSLSLLLSRIAHGFTKIGPVVVGLAGCQSAVDASTSKEVPAIKLEVQEAPVVDDTPKPIGDFSITFYYVVGEEEVAAKTRAQAAKVANDNVADKVEGDGAPEGEETLAAVNADPKVTIYSGTCEPIAEVSKEFAAALALQGTGQLQNNQIINI